jgi:hypothetical protein
MTVLEGISVVHSDTTSIAVHILAEQFDDDPLGCVHRKGACAKQVARRDSVESIRLCRLSEEVLVGLYDHISLKTLGLVTHLTKSSSLALRSPLHCNRTLERLILEVMSCDNEKIPAMVAVLVSSSKHRRERACSKPPLSKPTQH